MYDTVKSNKDTHHLNIVFIMLFYLCPAVATVDEQRGAVVYGNDS